MSDPTQLSPDDVEESEPSAAPSSTALSADDVEEDSAPSPQVATGGAEGNLGTPPPDKPGMTPLATDPPVHLGSSVGDTLRTVGSHAANLVTGPATALLAPPEGTDEKVVDALGGGTPAALGAYRMLVKPSIAPAKSAFSKFKSGDYAGGIRDAESAIPVVGPWADQVEKDVKEKGAVAGLAGLATDVLGGKAAGKVGGKVISRFADRTIPVNGENFTPHQHAAFSGVLARASGMGDNFIPQDVASGAGSYIRQAAADNPAYADAVQNGTPKDAMGATQAILDEAKKKVDMQHQSALDPVRNTPVNTKPTLSKITPSSALRKAFPEDAADVDDVRARLGKVDTLGDLNDIRMELNKKLAAEYKRTDAAGARSEAGTAALRDAAGALRNLYYAELEKATGLDFSEAKRMEGHIIQAKEALQKSAPGLLKKQALADEPKGLLSEAADAIEGGSKFGHGGLPLVGYAAEKMRGTPLEQVHGGLKRFFSNLPEPSKYNGPLTSQVTRAPRALPASTPINAEFGGAPEPSAPFTGGGSTGNATVTPAPVRNPQIPAQAGPDGAGIPEGAPRGTPNTVSQREGMPLPPQAGQLALPAPSGAPDFVRPPASPPGPVNEATAVTRTNPPLPRNPQIPPSRGVVVSPEGQAVVRHPQLPAPIKSIKTGQTLNIGDEITSKGRKGTVTGVNPKTGKVVIKWK